MFATALTAITPRRGDRLGHGRVRPVHNIRGRLVPIDPDSDLSVDSMVVYQIEAGELVAVEFPGDVPAVVRSLG